MMGRLLGMLFPLPCAWQKHYGEAVAHPAEGRDPHPAQQGALFLG